MFAAWKNRGSRYSHVLKITVRHIFSMVWMYLSPPSLTLSDFVPKGFHDRLHMYNVCPLACVDVKSSSCIVHPLTVAGAQEVLPAGPQQAGESRHAGGDLPLQQRTNSGANLQQVVWSDVSVQLHLNTSVQSATSDSRTAEKKKKTELSHPAKASLAFC